MATTPVFLFGKIHGQRSLEGYSPWGRQESQTTEHNGTSGTAELWEQLELALNPLLIYTWVTLDWALDFTGLCLLVCKIG